MKFNALVQLSSSEYINLDVDWKTIGDDDTYGGDDDNDHYANRRSIIDRQGFESGDYSNINNNFNHDGNDDDMNSLAEGGDEIVFDMKMTLDEIGVDELRLRKKVPKNRDPTNTMRKVRECASSSLLSSSSSS